MIEGADVENGLALSGHLRPGDAELEGNIQYRACEFADYLRWRLIFVDLRQLFYEWSRHISMGLPMANIHAPTVASGPISRPAANEGSKENLSLMGLMAEKTRIEEELSALSSVLGSVRRKLGPSREFR